MKILVIEDSERLRRSLAHGLQRSGFAVDVVGDGEEGLEYARHGCYDAIVLDLMLPKRDGLSVLRALRRHCIQQHVLILSAKERVEERIEGLEHGADDYLTKPFDFGELVARLRALVRRKYATKNPVQRVGALAMDTARRTLHHGDREIALTRNEFSVLEYLVVRRGRIVAKTELLDHLYGGAGHGTENAVEVFVHQVRKKLDGSGTRDLIRTHRGLGYSVS